MLSSQLHPPIFFRGMYQTITAGEIWQGEICNRAKDGSQYWADTIIVPTMKSGRIVRYTAISIDMTGRKHSEHEGVCDRGAAQLASVEASSVD